VEAVKVQVGRFGQAVGESDADLVARVDFNSY
jgi:hypothetical protein